LQRILFMQRPLWETPLEWTYCKAKSSSWKIRAICISEGHYLVSKIPSMRFLGLKPFPVLLSKG